MAKHPRWSDEYWPQLLQVYLEKPMGVKPLYDKRMVDLSLEWHIPPQYLHKQMFQLRLLTPPMERLWATYGDNPKKLKKDITTLRKMRGLGNAELFYEGVEVNESFEKDWHPLETHPELTPVKLILVLDLYFQLTPITMRQETPEVIELGKLIKVKPTIIAEVMEVYQICDPYLNHGEVCFSPLLPACDQIWRRYGNEHPDKLYTLATQLKEYFIK